MSVNQLAFILFLFDRFAADKVLLSSGFANAYRDYKREVKMIDGKILQFMHRVTEFIERGALADVIPIGRITINSNLAADLGETTYTPDDTEAA